MLKTSKACFYVSSHWRQRSPPTMLLKLYQQEKNLNQSMSTVLWDAARQAPSAGLSTWPSAGCRCIRNHGKDVSSPSVFPHRLENKPLPRVAHNSLSQGMGREEFVVLQWVIWFSMAVSSSRLVVLKKKKIKKRKKKTTFFWDPWQRSVQPSWSWCKSV